MAKTRSKVRESTRDLEQFSKALFDRAVQSQTDIGNALQLARRLEAQLLEKERQEQKAREETEQREQLRTVLERDRAEQEQAESAAQAEAADPADPAKPAAPTEPALTARAPQEPVAAKPVIEPPRAEQRPPMTERPRETIQPQQPPPREIPRQQQPPRAPWQRDARPQRETPRQGFGAHPGQNTARPAFAPGQGNSQGPRQPRDGQQGRPGFAPGQQGGYPRGPREQRPFGQQRPPGTPGAPRPFNQGQPRPGGGFARPGFAGAGAKPAPVSTAAGKDKVSNYDPNRGAYTRNYDAEKKSKSRKTLVKESAPTVAAGWDEERFGSRKRPKKVAERIKPEPIVIEKAVITTEKISIKDLSEKLGKPSSMIIKKLFNMGVMATINHEIDFETVELVALEFGITVEQQLAKTYEEVMLETADNEDDPETLMERPPVVTIMGHVDHGKTSILDAIRKTSVAHGEAGGITQHIGAYTVTCNGKQITFIDTPGHEAFTSMRARGAQVTDIVVLVVAADDGIMPQTIEAINHSKAAGVPIIVAVNKIDKPTADPDRIKQQLTEHGLVSEEWGGDTICVLMSAKTGQGLEALLEMILLEAEVLELRANPNRPARGVIIEAQLDKGRGPVATVLIQNGSLKLGDTIVAGTAYGRVRAMMDDKGSRTEVAMPSDPVEVLGFSDVPEAGDLFNAVEVDKLSRQVAEERKDKQKAEQLKTLAKVSLDDLFTQIAEGQIKDLNIIIKADVQGSAEAVKQALEKLSNAEVRVRCVHSGVGAIAESDIMLASVSNAIVVGFNVRPNNMARAAMEKEKIDVRLYRVIYNAVEDIQNAMKGMLAPEFKDVELGQAEVRNVFRVTGVGTVAGCYVQEGKVLRNAKVRVVRDGVVVHDGKIDSLKRFKDDVREVAAGYECGISIESFNDVKEGDILEAFIVEEVKR